MISLDQVLSIHDRLIQIYGGSDGIRDRALLESAINRPFATYGSNELYPETITKSAVLLESLISNHPFVDGNKRTGYVVFRAYLLIHNYDIDLSEDKRYDFVIAIASGSLRGDELIAFVKSNVIN